MKTDLVLPFLMRTKLRTRALKGLFFLIIPVLALAWWVSDGAFPFWPQTIILLAQFVLTVAMLEAAGTISEYLQQDQLKSGDDVQDHQSPGGEQGQGGGP